jgi:uncharacterized membrane protein (UPF0127 family)
MKEAKIYKITKNNKKLVLSNMNVAKNHFQKSFGLMLSKKTRCKKGMLFEFLEGKEVRFGASITMFLCFHSLDIIFINRKNIIVDKTTLRPFKWCYTPKKKCLFVVETLKGGFSNLKIGDKVEIK